MTGKLEEVRERRIYATEHGPRFYKNIERHLKGEVPSGTFIVVNCLNGKYVHAPTRLAAVDEFRARFGNAIGWVRKFRA